MENKPEISIIIPCYNVPRKCVETALESVFSQTYDDYELIVVDDGSAQKYHDMLVDISARYKTKLITQKNQGVSSARNTGIQAAEGKYIAFLDADDMLAADFLERAHDVALETAAEFIIGGVQYFECLPRCNVLEREGSPRFYIYSGSQQEALKVHLLGTKYRLEYNGGYIGRGPVARLIKAETARQNIFDTNLKMGEDCVWNLQLCNQVRNTCVVFETWYYYWSNPSSASHRFSMTIALDYEAQFHAMQEQIDLSDDRLFLSYIDRMKENLRHIWKCCAKQLRKQDPAAYHQLTERIYNGQIWSILGDQRLYRLSDLKGKLFVLAYRNKFLFDYYYFKEIVKDHIYAR